MTDITSRSVSLATLQMLGAGELLARATAAGLELVPNLGHAELVAALVLHELHGGRAVHAEGVLEVRPEGFGFLRSPQRDYRSEADDVYVSPSQLRALNLKTGHRLAGALRAPRGTERFLALQAIDGVNDTDGAGLARRIPFAARLPIVPTRRLPLSTTKAAPDLHALTLLAPWSFGHRVLITAPPTWPRAQLLRRLAAGIRQATAEPWLCLCLLEQRPEDVAAVRAQLLTTERCELVATTFDEPPERHVAVAELMLARAQREVEGGADVVLFVDSLTALSRASHLTQPGSGRWLCPGLDAGALQPGKRLFAAARATAEGGSLTILAAALRSDSPVDQAVLEAFARHGNSEIVVTGDVDEALPFDIRHTRTRPEDDPRSPAERLAAAAELERLRTP